MQTCQDLSSLTTLPLSHIPSSLTRPFLSHTPLPLLQPLLSLTALPLLQPSLSPTPLSLSLTLLPLMSHTVPLLSHAPSSHPFLSHTTPSLSHRMRDGPVVVVVLVDDDRQAMPDISTAPTLRGCRYRCRCRYSCLRRRRRRRRAQKHLGEVPEGGGVPLEGDADFRGTSHEGDGFSRQVFIHLN